MPLFEVKNLVKIYENEGVKTPALNGVSFDIERGEFVAIMGPSGSGKSTLLHILGFLDRQTNGAYKFDKRSIDDYGEEDLAKARNKKMGFVFQSFNLLPHATVFENVKLPLLYSETPEQKWNKLALDAIAAVGLTPRKDYEAVRLSGGEKQRVAIARALVNDPDVIFADEPTGNLDSRSGQAIMEIVQQLNDEGRTIILITHESYTAEMAKRIIRMKDGLLEKDDGVGHRRIAKDNFVK